MGSIAAAQLAAKAVVGHICVLLLLWIVIHVARGSLVGICRASVVGRQTRLPAYDRCDDEDPAD
jgi:hypothetical protein